MIKKAITNVCFGIGYSIGTVVAGFEKAVSKERENGCDSEGCESTCEDACETFRDSTYEKEE